MDILIPYLHYIGIMVLMGALVAQHLMTKTNMDKYDFTSLVNVDRIYWIAAIIALTTGLLRWFFVDPKGVDFFNTNPLFHIKVTLFVVLLVLSIFTTLKFYKWRNKSKMDSYFTTSEKEAKKQLMLIRIELLLMVIIPLLAVMVAKGVRM